VDRCVGKNAFHFLLLRQFIFRFIPTHCYILFRIKEYPPYCDGSMSCERGEGALKYRWGFVYGFVLVTFAWLACAMIMIFHDVHTTEKRARKYRHGRHDSSSAHSQSREVAAQALLYSLAYSIPWIWGLILSFINTAAGVFGSAAIDDAITALNIVNVVIFPLQGFLNVFVYVRPRYIEARKRDPDSSVMQMAWRTMFPKAEADGGFTIDLSLANATRRASLVGRRSSTLFRTPPPKPNVQEHAHDGDSNMEIENKKAGVLEYLPEENEDDVLENDGA